MDGEARAGGVPPGPSGKPGGPETAADAPAAGARARPREADSDVSTAPPAVAEAPEAVDEPGESAEHDHGPADRVDKPVIERKASASSSGSGRSRSWSRPVAITASTVVAVALGFGLTVQIRISGETDPQVGTREEDLVVILDELNTREEALRRQIGETRQTIEELTSGQQQSERAAEEAQARAEAIGILNGTLPATGPGIRLTIEDPDGAVPTSVVLDAIQELRGADAEALQVDGVRVVVSSAVTGSPGALRIDGVPLDSPYEFVAVGPPAAMDIALNVSGGVVADVSRVGGTATVRQTDIVTVDATVG